MIYVGIDDTDVEGSPGTNHLARLIVSRLGSAARGSIITRHQLFFDPRVPYTSGNGSASIQLPHGGGIPRPALLDRIRTVMREWYVEGSDPGLAAAERSAPAIDAFAARAKTEVVSQAEARAVAAETKCHLEGLGGDHGQVVLAAHEGNLRPHRARAPGQTDVDLLRDGRVDEVLGGDDPGTAGAVVGGDDDAGGRPPDAGSTIGAKLYGGGQDAADHLAPVGRALGGCAAGSGEDEGCQDQRRRPPHPSSSLAWRSRIR